MNYLGHEFSDVEHQAIEPTDEEIDRGEFGGLSKYLKTITTQERAQEEYTKLLEPFDEFMWNYLTDSWFDYEHLNRKEIGQIEDVICSIKSIQAKIEELDNYLGLCFTISPDLETLKKYRDKSVENFRKWLKYIHQYRDNIIRADAIWHYAQKKGWDLE